MWNESREVSWMSADDALDFPEGLLTTGELNGMTMGVFKDDEIKSQLDQKYGINGWETPDYAWNGSGWNSNSR